MLTTDIARAVVFLSRSPELELLAKATLILIVCLIITRATMRARASVRHLIVATSFAALMALPILIASVPAIAIEMPAVTVPKVTAVPQVPGVQEIRGVPEPPTPAPLIARVLPWSITQWARAIWLAGVIVFMIPVIAAWWRLSIIRRTGLPVAWHRDDLSRLADARGVSVPVELLEREAVPGPMTFGISRPVIVLPPDAREWSQAELRRALMHELEHIQRGDWIMQIVARIVAALYWFHPLVWSAWRRLCLEAERSCDDAVVISEERTDYAEQLVTLAQRMAATPSQPMLGMANRSDLSTRVTAVLDDRLRRGRAGFTFAAGTIAAAALMVLTVAPVRAIAKADAVIDQASSQELARKLEEVKARVEMMRKIEEEKAARGQVSTPEEKKARAEKFDEELRKVEEARKRTLELKVRRGDGRKVRAIDRALYEAANDGSFDEVKELVQAGANPSATIYGDGNALIGAARSGRSEIARYLLDQGADPNGVVEGDGSPLIAAAQNGRLDQVQLLVERGADVNLAVEGDENPLMNAAEVGHLAIVQYLVSKGADIHARIFSEKMSTSYNDKQGVFTQRNGEWRTALSQARKKGHADVVKYLESLGAQ